MIPRQHQMELVIPTYRNEHFKPGWYSNALIPFRHPLTRKALPKARLAAEAERIVRPLAESFFKWQNDPAAQETARAKLAEMIVSQGKSW